MRENTAVFVVPAYITDKVYLHFLEETLQSFLNQTDDNWEAIIVDDNSDEAGTREMLEKYMEMDERIHAVFLDKRRSTGFCRNIGIQWANEHGAAYVLFNDADDISHKERVKDVRSVFCNHPEADVIYSNVNIIDEHANVIEQSKLSPAIVEILDALKDNPPQGGDCWYDFGIRTGYVNITSATAVRMALATKELFPDEMVSEDFHTWFRYAAQGNIYYINRKLTNYRIPSFVKRQSSSRYVDDFNLNKMRVDMDGFGKALDIAMSRGRIDEHDRNMIEVKFLVRLAESMGNNQRYDLAYQVFMQCKERISLFEDVISKNK